MPERRNQGCASFEGTGVGAGENVPHYRDPTVHLTIHK
jgi:hypothetical protein